MIHATLFGDRVFNVVPQSPLPAGITLEAVTAKIKDWAERRNPNIGCVVEFRLTFEGPDLSLTPLPIHQESENAMSGLADGIPPKPHQLRYVATTPGTEDSLAERQSDAPVAIWPSAPPDELFVFRPVTGSYLKTPGLVEVAQWFKNGDHPHDGPADQEGEVVRYYRDPGVDGQAQCTHCRHVMHDHGWIDVPTYGIVVCPGDCIINPKPGQYYPIRPALFTAIFQPEAVKA